MDRKKELLWRAYFVMFCFGLASVVILFKVFKVGIIERDKWRQKGEVNVKWRTVDADRGNIYGEEDNLLSTSLQFFEVRMDMSVVSQELFNSEVDSLAIFLSSFDPMFIKTKSREQWLKDLKAAKKKGNRYFFIAKGLDIDAYNKLKAAPILKYGSYKGGLIKSRYGKRVKPYGELASRTIGVDRENADKVGLEGYFDRILKGESDQRLMKRLPNNFGERDVWVPVYDPSENEIKTGDDIYTTLNVDMQDIVHHELLKSLKANKAEGGVAILMEVGTGAIKAISNLTRAQDSSYYEMYNLGVTRLSEPGSTMKLATMLAVMEDGITNLDTLIDLSYGAKRFADRVMHDSEKHGRTLTTLAEAFEISSNVGIASVANDLYNSRDGRVQWIKRMKQFGLNEATGIDILGEPVPIIKDPVKDKTKWYSTTVPWMAHGYELMMTPLQMLNLYNSVANAGKMMKPFLVEEIRKGNEVKKKFSPVVLSNQIAKPDNIKKAKQLLENVVLKGTGKNIFSEYVTIAGKTGTSRVNYANKADYARYNASFCGYFPAENPMYSMIVVVYDPRGGVFYGSYVAGPVFKRIAERVYTMKTKQVRSLNESVYAAIGVPGKAVGYHKDFNTILDYLNIKYKDTSDEPFSVLDPSANAMILEDKKIKNTLVPDVRGMGLRDAVYLMEYAGLNVNVKGVGKVRRQSVSPGTVARGNRVVLELD